MSTPLPPSQASSSSTQVHASSSRSRTDAAPPTPLRPVKSSSGFEFPAMWSFPPFFTLQPNPQTLSHQLSQWRSLVLDWAKHERVWEVNTEGEVGGVWENKTIGRRLLPPAMKQLLTEMVKNGDAAPDPPKQDTRYLLYWRKPEEWGDIIYHWVMDNGLNSSIMTFYEITDGDLSHTTEFRELPTPLLRRALETLVKRGRAQILEGKGEIGEGVRFF